MAAKTEQERVDTTTAQDQTTLLRAWKQLDEGLKALATRLKFIKIADRSELDCAMIKYYQSDPLASDSEDEKDLGRAEKKVRKTLRGNQLTVARGKAVCHEEPVARSRCQCRGHISQQCHQASKAAPAALGTLIDMWCAWSSDCQLHSHQTISFISDKMSIVDTKCDNACADEEASESIKNNSCIDGSKECDIPLLCESVEGTNQSMTKYWEVEQTDTVRTSEIELAILEGYFASPTSFFWIGYRLPLKHNPSLLYHQNHNLTELQKAFVDGAVHDLLENRCIQRVGQKPVVCSQLPVVSNSTGRLRLRTPIYAHSNENLPTVALLFETNEY